MKLFCSLFFVISGRYIIVLKIVDGIVFLVVYLIYTIIIR